jgi:hypothetical protein
MEGPTGEIDRKRIPQLPPYPVPARHLLRLAGIVRRIGVVDPKGACTRHLHDGLAAQPQTAGGPLVKVDGPENFRKIALSHRCSDNTHASRNC